MDKETFFIGLLLNLPPKEFSTNTNVLRKAFAAALHTAHVTPGGPKFINGIDWEVADDPLRQTRFVNELIAFGMSSRLLMLYSVDLEIGLPSPIAFANRERLTRIIGYYAWFRTIGKVFASHLDESQ